MLYVTVRLIVAGFKSRAVFMGLLTNVLVLKTVHNTATTLGSASARGT